MYQRHDPREYRPGRSEFRDYDDFQQDNFQQDRFEDQQHQQPVREQRQQQQRRFHYSGSATTNASRRYQDQWSPDWMTRGGAPEYRRNSSGQGEMYGLRQDTSWDHSTAGNYEGSGEFAGKGPKGYSRADQRIEEDLNESLTRHPHLDATDIEVKVKDGVATLAGSVRTKQCKRVAEDIAEDISGIKDVQNQLRVVGGSQSSTSSTSQSQQQNRGQGERGRTTH